MNVRTCVVATVAAVVVAAGGGTALAGSMHPELGARLSGMGEHGIVNLTLKSSHHEICWTFDIPTKGVTSASVRDAHGMLVAKLGARYSKKGCAMEAAAAVTRIESAPTKYRSLGRHEGASRRAAWCPLRRYGAHVSSRTGAVALGPRSRARLEC